MPVKIYKKPLSKQTDQNMKTETPTFLRKLC